MNAGKSHLWTEIGGWMWPKSAITYSVLCIWLRRFREGWIPVQRPVLMKGENVTFLTIILSNWRTGWHQGKNIRVPENNFKILLCLINCDDIQEAFAFFLFYRTYYVKSLSVRIHIVCLYFEEKPKSNLGFEFGDTCFWILWGLWITISPSNLHYTFF